MRPALPCRRLLSRAVRRWSDTVSSSLTHSRRQLSRASSLSSRQPLCPDTQFRRPQQLAVRWTPTRLPGHHRLCSRSAALGASREEAAEAAPEPVCREVVIEDLNDELAEQLAEVLLEEGASAVSVTEHRAPGAPEQERFGSDAPLWDSCALAVSFPLDADVAGALGAAQRALGLPDPLPYQVRDVPAEDWIKAVEASFQPRHIAGHMWIVPAWSEVPKPDALSIRLEPGLAFGTGEHPTTRLCLKWLHSLPLEGRTVLDYGTGCGVLAIGALLRGAAGACAADTDPLALRAARGNAALSGVEARLEVEQCGSSPQGGEGPFEGRDFNVCVANILQGPLLDLQPRLSAYVKSGGLIGLSGILASQVPEVKLAYSEAFEAFESYTEEGWALLVGRKRQPDQ